MSSVKDGPKSSRPNPQPRHTAQSSSTDTVTSFYCKNCRGYRTPTGIRYSDKGIDFTCKNCRRPTRIQF